MGVSPEDALGPGGWDKLTACLDLLGRGGASEVQIRYHDDEEPVVWMVVTKARHGGAEAAALDPLTAAVRLLEQILDGVGFCMHCRRPTAVDIDWDAERMLEDTLCWYVYDPETKKFRRSCEGETTGRVGRNDPCPCGSGVKFKKCHGTVLHARDE